MADFIDSITEGIKVYEYHALLKPYFRMLAVLCSIGDSKQADRINAVMTATLEAVRAQSRYWYATKHCLNLLIQTAKHHHTVCGWLKEVSQPACRGRGVGGRVCDINACGTAGCAGLSSTLGLGVGLDHRQPLRAIALCPLDLARGCRCPQATHPRPRLVSSTACCAVPCRAGLDRLLCETHPLILFVLPRFTAMMRLRRAW